MQTHEKKFILNGGNYFDIRKKLNAMKISMAQIIWYKEDSRNRRIGYYDSYKNMNFSSDQDAVESHKSLTYFWETIVQEVNNQNGGAGFTERSLCSATNYRVLVEPLAIAEYYRNGGKDYMTNRSQHFVLLEEWFSNYPTKTETSNIHNSYFWECVQKALLSRQPSMVAHEMENNFNLLSDDENEDEISTMCPSFWSSVDQLLLSFKELHVDEEDLDGKVEWDAEPCFEAHVDRALLSRQGSVKENENNINGFGALVDKTLLSRQESMVVRDRIRQINVPIGLTYDSCFWAHVEEALLLCQELKVVQEKQETLKKLVQFEDYVYGLLHNYQVSEEIFLKESSYMRWWNEYKAIKGTAHDSKLASFMNDPSKRRLYALEINFQCVKYFHPERLSFSLVSHGSTET